jgi:hypothetical protein
MRNACREGDLSYIKNELEDNIMNYNNHIDDYTHPVFMCAVGGHNECIEYVIKKLPCSSEMILESIGIAIICNHLETADYLFKKLKKYDTKHPRLINALNISISKKNRQAIDYLLDRNIYDEYSDDNAFVRCAKVGDIQTIKRLMELYIDYTNYLQKSIEVAILSGNTHIVNLFFGKT